MRSLPAVKLDSLCLNCADGTEPICHEKFAEKLQQDASGVLLFKDKVIIIHYSM